MGRNNRATPTRPTGKFTLRALGGTHLSADNSLTWPSQLYFTVSLQGENLNPETVGAAVRGLMQEHFDNLPIIVEPQESEKHHEHHLCLDCYPNAKETP